VDDDDQGNGDFESQRDVRFSDCYHLTQFDELILFKLRPLLSRAYFATLIRTFLETIA